MENNGEIIVSTEKDYQLPKSVATLVKLNRIEEKFRDAVNLIYFPENSASYKEIVSKTLNKETKALSINKPIETVAMKQNSLRTLMEGLLGIKKNTQQELNRNPLTNILQEIDKLKADMPFGLTFQVDDNTPSTTMRGRVYARVSFPKNDLDSLLESDGLKLKIEGTEHKVTIFRSSDGKEINVKLPYLFEGPRLYAQKDQYLFESITSLDVNQKKRVGNKYISDKLVALQNLLCSSSAPNKQLVQPQTLRLA